MKVRAGLLVVLFLASVFPIVNADETTPITINRMDKAKTYGDGNDLRDFTDIALN